MDNGVKYPRYTKFKKTSFSKKNYQSFQKQMKSIKPCKYFIVTQNHVKYCRRLGTPCNFDFQNNCDLYESEKCIMECKECNIDELRLTHNTYTALKQARLLTIQDIINKQNQDGLFKVRNLGKKGYLEIKQALLEQDIILPEKNK